MIEAGLSPTDPARWWLAYVVERDAEDEQRRTNGEADIQVVDDEPSTL